MTGQGRCCRQRWVGWLLATLLLFLATAVWARVGGGESYGGGGEGSGGGGGDDGGILSLALYLALEYPQVGIPLLLLVIIGIILKKKFGAKALPQSSQRTFMQIRSGAAAVKRALVKAQVQALTAVDANFSEVLFLDFVQLIYTRYQEARGSGDVGGLLPYLSPELTSQFQQAAASPVSGKLAVSDVVVGRVVIDELAASAGVWSVQCEVEANYTETIPSVDGKPEAAALYSRSKLTLQRAVGILSKTPEQMRALGCPSCGSPTKLDRLGVCAFCNQAVRPGLFHWQLSQLLEVERQARVDVAISQEHEEAGSDFPTVFDPELDAQVKAFLMRNPGDSVQRLLDRAKENFLLLQQAWSTDHWEEARAFETDRLFQMHLFWMERYRDKKIRNQLEQIQVLEVSLVKIARDAFLELATLRIKASMLDYKIDAQGALVGGSKNKVRVFSEYWTFIRKAGIVVQVGANTSTCPSCGAPVKVGMNGRCEYCDAHLSSGDFDWTLSKIEQDEAYVG